MNEKGVNEACNYSKYRMYNCQCNNNTKHPSLIVEHKCIELKKEKNISIQTLKNDK